MSRLLDQGAALRVGEVGDARDDDPARLVRIAARRSDGTGRFHLATDDGGLHRWDRAVYDIPPINGCRYLGSLSWRERAEELVSQNVIARVIGLDAEDRKAKPIQPPTTEPGLSGEEEAG